MVKTRKITSYQAYRGRIECPFPNEGVHAQLPNHVTHDSNGSATCWIRITSEYSLERNPMNPPSNLAPLLEGFFTQRLIAQRRASPHTIAAYRDTFRLLLGFVQKRSGRAPSKLTLADLNAAIRERIDAINDRPMKIVGVSRRALWAQLDRPALRPLPSTRS